MEQVDDEAHYIKDQLEKILNIEFLS
jgi:hypothetical protein